MNTKQLFSLGLTILILLLFGCNPECNSLTGLRVDSGVKEAGDEILIKAEPLTALQGRRVVINNEVVESRWVSDVGLIAKVPNVNAGKIELKLEDEDCQEFLLVNLNIVDETFFIDNPNFISPAPPEIILPVTPAVFPADIANAWISPQNNDYCLWFGDFKKYEFLDDTGGVVFSEETNILASGSFELSVCDNDTYYQKNPFFGIVDYENNIIEITIDRTRWNLGTESFKGEFIDINSTPYTRGKSCPQDPSLESQKKHMMLLTSLTTGRQLIVFKNSE